MCCLIHLRGVYMVVLLKSYLEKIKEHFIIIVNLFYVHYGLQVFPLTLLVICHQPFLAQVDCECYVQELLIFIITPSSAMLVNEQCRDHCALGKYGGCPPIYFRPPMLQMETALHVLCSLCVESLGEQSMIS